MQFLQPMRLIESQVLLEMFAFVAFGTSKA